MRNSVNFLLSLLIIFSFTTVSVGTALNGASALEKCTESKLRDLQVAILDCSDSNQQSSNVCSVDTSGKLKDKSVYVLGDSITKGVETKLQRTFSKEGALNSKIDGLDSRPVGSVNDATSGLGVLSGNNPYLSTSNKIVIELGTNGGLTTEDINKTISTIKAVNSTADIYWVNIGVNNSFRDTPLDVTSFNDLLNSSQSAGYKVIDWANVVLQNPSYINPDNNMGINPTTVGNEALVDLIIKSIGVASFCNGNLVGSDNQQRAFNFFVDNGYTPQQAAGIVANMIIESGVLPMRKQSTPANENYPSATLNLNDTSYGWGIVQWTPAKKIVQGSINNDPGVSYSQIDTLAFQLSFLKSQLGNDGGVGALAASEIDAGNNLRQTTTAEEAASVFAMRYERCADCKIESSETVKTRISIATQVLIKYGS